MIDPTKGFLISEEELQRLPAPKHRWRTQSSGIALEPAVARAIDLRVLNKPLLNADEAALEPFDPKNIEDGREKIKREIVLRRGQRVFRTKLLSAYDEKCAITGCDLVDLLEAAHILPFKGPDTNDVRNGLLLRSDMHTLFDCGLISIDTKTMTIMVAPEVLRTTYRSLEKRKLRLPKVQNQRPSTAALDAHRRANFGN